MTAKGDRARDALMDAIIEFESKYGFSPTLSELAAMVNLSKSTVFKHMAKLRDEGLVDSPRPGVGWRLR
jgi:DNA-binding IscR family transcriptional regulator